MKYTDSKGNVWEFEKMADHHLVNAYIKHRKALKALQEAVDNRVLFLDDKVKAEMVDSRRMVDSLKAELVNRGLLE